MLLVGCDHASKRLAKGALEGKAPHPVVGRALDLQYRENRDTAFGLLRRMPEGLRAPVLLVVGALAIAALATVALRRRRLDLTTGALFLLLAGALGNYSDRLFRGYVVDFIHLPFWPVFNAADVYLTVGLGLLVLVRARGAPDTAPP
jgi:signal peptidase II